MPQLSPFDAIRYAPAAGDPDLLLAPPYDVIDDDLAQSLRDCSPYNAVRLVLPEGDAPGRYELAAARLREWLDTGILERSNSPAAFVYRQEFDLGGKRATRDALITALELSEFGTAGVLPHERTHRGPKEDRLALMLATRAQLSAVFLIADDVEQRLPALFERATRPAPLMSTTTPDGVGHHLWHLDPDLSESLCRAAGDGELLMADGHHRYETALELARRLPDRPAAGRVLAAIVGAHDGGLVVEPTHRRLQDLPSDWEERLSVGFQVETAAADAAELADLIRAEGGATMGIIAGAESLVLRPREANPLGDLSPAEARLAAVVFERAILEPWTGAGSDAAARGGRLSYHRDPMEGVDEHVRDGSAGVFLLPPISMDDLWAVTRAGKRLPPKSTYFAPKIPSGIVFRPI